VVPSERFADAARAVKATLRAGESRLIAALAPVLVENIDAVHLRKLDADLATTGLERRLRWLADGVRDALAVELGASPPPSWARRYRRAQLVLTNYLDSIGGPSSSRDLHPDLLDPTVRSQRTAAKLLAASSGAAKRWAIVTPIRTEDFAEALRNARALG
jgi:hypothetical protein